MDSSLPHHSTAQPGSGPKADPLKPGRCLPGSQDDWPFPYPQDPMGPDFPWAFPGPRTRPGRQDLQVQSLQTRMCRHKTDPNGSKGIHFQAFCFQRFSFLNSPDNIHLPESTLLWERNPSFTSPLTKAFPSQHRQSAIPLPPGMLAGSAALMQTPRPPNKGSIQNTDGVDTVTNSKVTIRKPCTSQVPSPSLLSTKLQEDLMAVSSDRLLQTKSGDPLYFWHCYGRNSNYRMTL